MSVIFSLNPLTIVTNTLSQPYEIRHLYTITVLFEGCRHFPSCVVCWQIQHDHMFILLFTASRQLIHKWHNDRKLFRYYHRLHSTTQYRSKCTAASNYFIFEYLHFWLQYSATPLIWRGKHWHFMNFDKRLFKFVFVGGLVLRSQVQKNRFKMINICISGQKKKTKGCFFTCTSVVRRSPTVVHKHSI